MLGMSNNLGRDFLYISYLKYGGLFSSLSVSSVLFAVSHVTLMSSGLKYRKSVAGKTAVFNGDEFILEETDWYLLDLFRLWWRYGISFIRLQMWVEEIMEKFMR